MVQKILSDKVMNERTNAYYSYYLGERNISVLPLNVYDPPERFIAYIKKNRENLNITLSDFELEQIISGMRLWICPYISRHLLSLNPLQARCRRYSRGER